MEQAKAERYGVFTLPTTLIVDPKGTVRHANYGLADSRKLANQLRALQLSGPTDHPHLAGYGADYQRRMTECERWTG